MALVAVLWILLIFFGAIALHGWLFQKAAAWSRIHLTLVRATGVALAGAVAEALVEIGLDVGVYGIPPDLEAMRASWWPQVVGSVLGFAMFTGVVAHLLDLHPIDGAILGLRFFFVQMGVVVGLIGATMMIAVWSGLLFQGAGTWAAQQAIQGQSAPVMAPAPQFAPVGGGLRR